VANTTRVTNLARSRPISSPLTTPVGPLLSAQVISLSSTALSMKSLSPRPPPRRPWSASASVTTKAADVISPNALFILFPPPILSFLSSAPWQHVSGSFSAGPPSPTTHWSPSSVGALHPIHNAASYKTLRSLLPFVPQSQSCILIRPISTASTSRISGLTPSESMPVSLSVLPTWKIM